MATLNYQLLEGKKMCDFDPPTIYEAKTVKARKAHKCCECRKPIEKGQMYIRHKGLWEGRFDEYKWCMICDGLQKKYKVTCFCFGQLHEAIQEEHGVIIK